MRLSLTLSFLTITLFITCFYILPCSDLEEQQKELLCLEGKSRYKMSVAQRNGDFDLASKYCNEVVSYGNQVQEVANKIITADIH
jgi:hypothetical protein